MKAKHMAELLMKVPDSDVYAYDPEIGCMAEVTVLVLSSNITHIYTDVDEENEG